MTGDKVTRPTKRLGELLIQKGLLTSAQLDEALRQQRATGEFLGAILLRLSLIQPEMLLTTLSEQFGMPCEAVTPERVDWSVVAQFPPSVLASSACFPIRADAESVTVAMANPLEAWALSAVQRAAGFRSVKPVLVLEEQLRRVQQAYRERSLRSITARLDDHGRPQAH